MAGEDAIGSGIFVLFMLFLIGVVCVLPTVLPDRGHVMKGFGMSSTLPRNKSMPAAAVVPVLLYPSVPEAASACGMVRVRGVDALFQAACDHGATVIGPPQTQVYGERQFTVADPFGHVWTFSESVEDVDPASWGGEYLDRDADET
jgi:hypothetical protein